MRRISEKILGIAFGAVLLFLAVQVAISFLAEYVWEVEHSASPFTKLINAPLIGLYYHPLATLVVVFVTLVLLVRLPWIRQMFRGYRIARGTDVAEVRGQRRGKRKRGTVSFGGRVVELDRAFLYIGVPGTGKTIQLKMLLGELFDDFRDGSGDTRLLIREYKRGDFLPAVHASGIPYKVINPAVPGTYAWDIAKDCTDDAACDDIAETLVPVKPGEHEFFADSARTIIAEVMKGLRARHGDTWSFHDFFHILCKESLILEVSRWAPMRGAPIELIIEKAASSGDSMATVIVRLNRRFQAIAAAWKDAPRLSLQDFIQRREILIIGHSMKAETAMNAISATLTDRLIKYALDLPNSTERRIYFLLDELSNMGKIPGYGNLIRVGRSKGAFPLSAIQDLSSFQSKYGKEEGESILGMHSYLSILECEPQTARYISDFLGELDIERDHYSTQTSLRGTPSITSSSQKERRKRLEPYELITEIPRSGPEAGVVGYYLGYYGGKRPVWRAEIPWKLVEEALPQEDEEVRAACDRGGAPMPSITPLTREDFVRLSLPLPDKQEETTEEDLPKALTRLITSLRAAEGRTLPTGMARELTRVWNLLYPGTIVPNDTKNVIVRLAAASEALQGSGTRKRTSYRPQSYDD